MWVRTSPGNATRCNASLCCARGELVGWQRRNVVVDIVIIGIVIAGDHDCVVQGEPRRPVSIWARRLSARCIKEDVCHGVARVAADRKSWRRQERRFAQAGAPSHLRARERQQKYTACPEGRALEQEVRYPPFHHLPTGDHARSQAERLTRTCVPANHAPAETETRQPKGACPCGRSWLRIAS